jgi:hypothetical protein
MFEALHMRGTHDAVRAWLIVKAQRQNYVIRDALVNELAIPPSSNDGRVLELGDVDSLITTSSPFATNLK